MGPIFGRDQTRQQMLLVIFDEFAPKKRGLVFIK